MTTLGDAAELDAAIGAVDWAALPPGVVRADLDAPSGRLARIVAGAEDAPRVLLVPGATGSKEDFLLMIPSLLAAGYRVESYDLAGQFESGGAGPENLDPPRAHYDYDLFCADLRAVLDAGRAPAHVLGYSFGGLVAQVLLVAQPELFASLALLTSPPDVGQVFRGVKRIGRFSGATSPHAGASLMLWGIRNNLNRVPPERIAFVRERFAQTRRASVDDIVGLMKRMPDVAEAVAALPLPKLVATGRHDLWPEAQYREYAARIGASIAVYDTGHSPCETTPHQLVRDLLGLYGETDQTPRE
ncbi:MAG: alpha/beta fold hydrolase [Microbacterium ginsengisoli]|jgi:pimeloyl-ACP methyl ester carboxylesterase|uniref:alpha/beta fold hydrolase n=2 Tax=Microbacteriaceae TaxID=85023 RepID=UPI0006F8F7EF|nr:MULTISPECIES: alpha/beta fold hydrolase [unclassified Microbacterium]KQR92830.1 alpha/beta hydrolase [Microbacterium sp. Leaf347]MBN9198931.1 alpha/beta fold hydrolase [Microbacterium ginsengisoli]OJU76154.1 MAG: alpha/beta hydrolase [Microbacterium sp. 71-23]